MKIRFQADADFNHLILLAAIRREPTLDFQSAAAGGLIGLGDPDVLAHAANAGRLLVTHDQRTMPRHFGELIAHSESKGAAAMRAALHRGGRSISSKLKIDERRVVARPAKEE